MKFFADLHVHSKFSRATSRDGDLEHLSLWAQRKGIAIVGTGDFTHPAWLAEIREKLVPAEPGLFRLREDIEKSVAAGVFPSCRAPTRFILQVEVSTIYKKSGKTRKVHHVILAPDLEKAEKIAQSLAKIGNIKSDGRPILGLDSRDLLEIVLESGAGSSLIPAHIWTPWFSALGSNSGFDSIDECYADLAQHIFALETGLSSDPPMNWRLSILDRYRLVSNSDAHSPSKLGREACVFDTQMDFFAMRNALKTGEGYGGTIEFFPEEGKYHLDGHRKCGVRFEPEETGKNSGLCPVCRKPLTIGVMNRVHELADRPEGTRPPNAPAFSSFVPLKEILSEILGAGPESKKVSESYENLIARLGPELLILDRTPVEVIGKAGLPALAEAIARMRASRVIREAGYDGEYGVIKFFRHGELEKLASHVFEFGDQESSPPQAGPPAAEKFRVHSSRLETDGSEETSRSASLNCELKTANLEPPGHDPEQQAAIEIREGPLLIIAGPGAGKTSTLTSRIGRLITDCGVLPEQCLAITFTRRAAAEMQERLRQIVPDKAPFIPVLTFHALGLLMLREQKEQAGLPNGFCVAGDKERKKILTETLKISDGKAERLLNKISQLKRSEAGPTDEDTGKALEIYGREMKKLSLVDFDDLIALPLKMLEIHQDIAELYRSRYKWISVDEYQDIDTQQYRLLKLLVPPGGNLCAIGDPDQAIYGFRGGDVAIFNRFTQDFPGAKIVQLKKNYRSGKMIVHASQQVISPASLVKNRVMQPLSDDATKIVIHESPTDLAEAEFVVHSTEQLIGGSTFFSMDSGRVAGPGSSSYSFADFAVLYRTDAQAEALCGALARSGMPFRKCSHHCLADSPLVWKIAEKMRQIKDAAGLEAPALPEDFPDSDKSRALARRSAGQTSLPGVPHGRPRRLISVLQCLETAIAGLDEAERKEVFTLAPPLRQLAERSADLGSFLSELAMGVEADLWDPRANCISLLTLHAAKGLEFPVVFVTGCEDGIIPLYWGDRQDCNLDEERRLFFVGMTRAKDRLFLCHARRRRRMGKIKEMNPSPFLRDIEEQLLDRSKAAFKKKRSPDDNQLTLF